MPWRPAEYRTVSAGIFLPLRSIVIAPVRLRLHRRDRLAEAERHGEVPQVVLERLDDFLVAELEHPLRFSTTVTLVPRAANMDAYSMPITPAPTTTIERGTRSRWMMPSESMIVLSSKATLDGRAGPGAGGDDDLVGGDLAGPAAAVVDLDVVRADELPRAADDRDAVAGELAPHDVVLAADHVR